MVVSRGMNLFDEIEAEATKHPKGACGVFLVLEQMDDEDRDALEAQLERPSIEIGHSVITSVLQRRGYDIKSRSVGAHRSGACGCSNQKGR